MKKRNLFLALAAAVVLAGCGKPDEAPDQQGGGTTPEAVTPEATPTPEPTPSPEPTPTPEPTPVAENFLELYKDYFYMGISLNPTDF